MAHHLISNICSVQHAFSQDSNILTTIVSKLCRIHAHGDPLYKVASSLYTPFLCSIIGSRKASEDIQHSQVLSPEALTWFSLGENSDISSGKLKLASALYCSGDLQRCEGILAALKVQLMQTMFVTNCCCYGYIKYDPPYYRQRCYETNEDVIKHKIAHCVAYSPSEIDCIPKEMKYEMFRSTQEDRPYRGICDSWMDSAVVDSLPFLYFLQNKVYKQLQRPIDQRRALTNLAMTVIFDPNLGHRETALNLCGQCIEQENLYMYQLALRCYVLSLKVRRRNNAAKWLVCRLLASLICG